MTEYDYVRRRRLPDYSAVVELTVLGGVPDIQGDALKVEHAASRSGAYRRTELIFRRGA
jgi:hypothetical protein